jgi:hypothetical protein
MHNITVFPWLPCVCWSDATFSICTVMIHRILLQPGVGDLVPMWYLTQEDALEDLQGPCFYCSGLSFALLYHYQQMTEHYCLVIFEPAMMRADKFCGSFHWSKS